MGTVAGVAAFVFLSRGTQAARRSRCWLRMWRLWSLLLWVDRLPMVLPEAVCMEFQFALRTTCQDHRVRLVKATHT